MLAATTEVLTPTSVEDGQDRAARRLRSTAARQEFVERMSALYRHEVGQRDGGYDAEVLLDRLRDALTNPLSSKAFDATIQDIAEDLFGDDRWAGR